MFLVEKRENMNGRNVQTIVALDCLELESRIFVLTLDGFDDVSVKNTSDIIYFITFIYIYIRHCNVQC